MERKYYEAYDDRYAQVHSRNLQWFYDTPTPVLGQIMKRYGVGKEAAILELGCGEGRDAYPLLRNGYNLIATDISPNAIAYAKGKWPEHEAHFFVLDCVAGYWEGKYDFIYAVAVIHMLVKDAHRDAFYRFLRQHLKKDGIGIVCTMGDGEIQRESDISKAFQLQERTHEQTGTKLQIAGTSCRIVNWQTFRAELERNGLKILETGMTDAMPDFSMLMYAVVCREEE